MANMRWSQVNFEGSFTKLSQCPSTNLLEIGIIGRSNVGKSSLINCLLDRKSIAKVSGTPGKTQTLNYYNIDSQFYIVDLPGYGYARVSKKQRALFKSIIENYLFHREQLICTLVLLDIRVKPMQSDMDFINRLAERGVPQIHVFTKVDKLKPDEIDAQLKFYKDALLKNWETLPKQFYTSSKTKEGLNELRAYLEGTVDQINSQLDE